MCSQCLVPLTLELERLDSLEVEALLLQHLSAYASIRQHTSADEMARLDSLEARVLLLKALLPPY